MKCLLITFQALVLPTPSFAEDYWKFTPNSQHTFRNPPRTCFEETNLSTEPMLGDHTFWAERLVCLQADGSRDVKLPRAGNADCSIKALFIDEWDLIDERAWIPFDEMLELTDPKSTKRLPFTSGHHGYLFACHVNQGVN